MKFRKKPVVIEAESFDPYGPSLPFSGRGNPCAFDGRKWYIKTIEGDMSLATGDWVIQGVNGEFYPCKPDTFAKTYEPVAAASPEQRAREIVGAAWAAATTSGTSGTSKVTLPNLLAKELENRIAAALLPPPGCVRDEGVRAPVNCVIDEVGREVRGRWIALDGKGWKLFVADQDAAEAARGATSGNTPNG
jgi:hypothetical protein